MSFLKSQSASTILLSHHHHHHQNKKKTAGQSIQNTALTLRFPSYSTGFLSRLVIFAFGKIRVLNAPTAFESLASKLSYPKRDPSLVEKAR